jgi:hypothetical protein
VCALKVKVLVRARASIPVDVDSVCLSDVLEERLDVVKCVLQLLYFVR